MKKIKYISIIAVMLMIILSIFVIASCREDATRTGITVSFNPPLSSLPHDTTHANLLPHLTVVANYDDDTTVSIVPLESMLSGVLMAGQSNTIIVAVGAHSASFNVSLNSVPITRQNQEGVTVAILGWKFGEKANTPTIEGTVQDGADVTFEFSATESFTTILENSPTTVGTWFVRAHLSQTANFNAFTTPVVKFVVAEVVRTGISATLCLEYLEERNISIDAFDSHPRFAHGATLEDVLPFVRIVAANSDGSTEIVVPTLEMLSIEGGIHHLRLNQIVVRVGEFVCEVRVRVESPPARVGISVEFAESVTMAHDAVPADLVEHITITAHYNYGNDVNVAPQLNMIHATGGVLVAGRDNSIVVTVNTFARTIFVPVAPLPIRESISVEFFFDGSVPHNATMSSLIPYVRVIAVYRDFFNNTITITIHCFAQSISSLTLDNLSGILAPNTTNTVTVTINGLSDTFEVEMDEVERIRKSLTVTFAHPSSTLPMGTTLSNLIDYLTVYANYTDNTSDRITIEVGMLSGKLFSGVENTITITIGSLIEIFVVVIEPEVAVDANTFVGMSMATNHAIAVTQEGNVYVWGNNNNGQLGFGYYAYLRPDRDNRNIPTRLEFFNARNVVQVVAGGNNLSLVRTSEGFVYAWGNGSNGATGQGNTSIQNVPSRVRINGTTYLSGVGYIAAGSSFAMAITTGGYLYSWGSNASGQQAQSTANNLFATRVRLDEMTYLSSVTLIAAGQNHAMAVSNGYLYTWGSNSNGLLGRGHADAIVATRHIPTRVENLFNIISISAHDHSMAVANGILNQGYVYTWGGNGSGILGHGHTSNILENNSPRRVEAMGGGATLVSAGSISMAVAGGNLYTWGAMGGSRLGRPLGDEFAVAFLPGRVLGLSNVGFVAAGRGANRGMAIGNNNNLYVWGTGGAGIGLGQTVNTNVVAPTMIGRPNSQ
ncbi:MAG: hypothetical protein FWC11_00705 [Firmicutes bacterium]|nr:hypothetical protein [Bacillota bacterium]